GSGPLPVSCCSCGLASPRLSSWAGLAFSSWAGLLAAGRDSSLGLASSCCSCANIHPLTPRNNDSVDTLTTLDKIFIGFISFDYLQALSLTTCKIKPGPTILFKD